MKKIALTSTLAMLAATPALALTPLDPTYRVRANQFTTSFGFAYSIDDDAGVMDGVSTTTFDGFSYGFTDDFNVSIETAAYHRPSIGVDYRFLKNNTMSLSLIGKYELDREDIIATGGVSASGKVDSKISWSVDVLGRYINMEATDVWERYDMLFSAAALYQLNNKWGLKADLQYDVQIMDSDANSELAYLYDRSLTIGGVYSLSANAAVMPYIARHFSQVVAYDGDDTDMDDGYWSIGAQFGVQF